MEKAKPAEQNREDTLRKIEETALRMRENILKMALSAGAGSSHLGGGLSIVDITATLYSSIMNFDSKNPEWPDRDRFILSKGHGCLGYYTALCEAGFVPKEDLLRFEKKEGYLLGHPVMNRSKAIEFSNGSLGMGLSLGIGVSLSAKRREQSFKTYVLMGDGECNEGSVWEAAMAAPHFKLDNLFAIVDRNRLQQTGSNEEIMNSGDMASKWRSFGWDVMEIDGHKVDEIYDALTRTPKAGVPICVVAHTVKGKGVSFAENNNAWHHAVLTQELYDQAMKELTAHAD